MVDRLGTTDRILRGAVGAPADVLVHVVDDPERALRKDLRCGRLGHSDATLYILYRESLMKYTGWC